MQLGPYRLLAQIGAGTDGASYRAVDADGDPVEVRVLSGAANPTAWKALVHRLKRAALIDHPAAVAARQLALDHNPPYVAMEWVEGKSLAEACASSAPAPPEALRIVRDLCAALTEAHSLGLAHGRLRPSLIRLTETGAAKLDLTGLEMGVSPPPAVLTEFEASCRAPELADGRPADSAADLFSLGMILYWLLRGRPGLPGHTPQEMLRTLPQETRLAPPSWQQLVPLLVAADPGDRPPARMVLKQLQGEDAASMNALTLAGDQEPPQPAEDAPPPARLGRFRLLEKLGEGGMGAVYRAEDVTDGTVVAVKRIQGQWSGREAAWQRMRKEARLLAEVNNPYVANFIEFNEHEGAPYLVMEFVEGESLSKILAARGRLPEAEALAVMADVARALTDAHRRGIVHRDVKPENILLCGEKNSGEWRVASDEKSHEENASPGNDPSSLATRPSPLATRVKLCDFGLARHVLQSESLNMTRDGAVLGTPFYASPEQCTGDAVDVRADVYAMGATLFHLLAGRPPFLADTVLAVTHLHVHEPAPQLQRFNPRASDGVCRLIEKALAKLPDARHADAEAFLLDVERVRRGEAVGLAAHPRLPSAAPGKALQYVWTWELEAAPEQLWPHVANTERLNRAAGIPAVNFTAEPDPAGGVRRFGSFRTMGIVNAWREHPFEWVEGRRLGVLREYQRGILKWLASTVELKPRAGGGTTLTHQVRVEPRNLLGRIAAAVEIGGKARRSLERVYRRIDAYVVGKLGRPEASDPFEPANALNPVGRQRLERLLDRLVALRVDPTVVEKFGDFLRNAPAQEVARIRPLALAARLGLDPDRLTEACLHGAREGLLVLLWDILCPICRIPSAVKDALRALDDHEHCPACNLAFKPDFAESVEMIFRVHPQVRSSELAVYCIGGPAHSPHVAAQVRVAPGETVELELALAEGAYRLRGPQLPHALDFAVRPHAPSRRWDVRLAPGPAPHAIGALQPGRQMLALSNEYPVEVVVRIERTAPRGDALTAARASTMALFRELFPGESLSPGRLASVTALALLATDLDPAGLLYEQFGDARAFGVLHGYLQTVGEIVRREGGAVVKTVGEGVLASFIDAPAALRVALELAGSSVSEMRPRVAVHHGPVMAATINDHLDYFGSTVSQVLRLPPRVHGGEVVFTQAVAADPQVAALLHARGLAVEVLPGEASEGVLHRIVVPPQ